MTTIANPYQLFTETDGTPLDAGMIYIGTANLDARTNPITVYWDESLTIPAVQPLRTIAGYPVYQGEPANVFVGAETYSIIVNDKNGALVFSDVSATGPTMTFTAEHGLKVRTVTSRLRETVSLADYFSSGDDPSGFTAAIAAAYQDGEILEIPQNFGELAIPAGSPLIIPANKGLVVGTRLTGVYGSRVEQAGGTSEIHFNGGHFENVYLHLKAGTPRVYNFAGSGRANVCHILVQGSGGASFRNLLIDGMDIQGANYGILEQGNSGANHSAYGSKYLNGQFYDLRGDAIELNLISANRYTTVQGHTIDYIDSLADATQPNWGLGIGVAGGSDFVIDDVFCSRQRQGIHVEYSQKFTVSNIRGEDISAAYSSGPNELPEVALVQIYGGVNFSVDDISGEGSVQLFYGGGGGTYTDPNRNFTVRDIHLNVGDVVIYPGAESGEVGTYATVENVELQSGVFQLSERPQYLTMRNINARRPNADGYALILTPDLAVDGRQAFRATSYVSEAVLDNVRGFNEYGANSVGYETGIGTYAPGTSGWVQAKVEATGCNFSVTDDYAPKHRNNHLADDFAGQFPVGYEVQVGDTVDCTATGVRWDVTGAGSRLIGTDTFVVASSPDTAFTGRAIKSTNYAWYLGTYHHRGQKIILPGCGPAAADLYTTVEGFRIFSGDSYLLVADNITAANGTAGTIGIPTAATYLRSIGNVSETFGNVDTTLTQDSADVIVYGTPLTVDRAITLPANGCKRRFRIVRNAAATGAAALTIGATGKTLAVGTWAEVVDDGAAWQVVAAGAL